MLLRKQQWSDQFACPDESSSSLRFKSDFYQWSMTRDAGSASVELSKSNLRRENGGLAYAKAYNTHKELFASPLKSHGLFRNKQLEGLGFSQSVLANWYRLNSGRGHEPHDNLQEKVVSSYQAAKRQIFDALAGSLSRSFGVRQEYRFRLHRLIDAIKSVPVGHHAIASTW